MVTIMADRMPPSLLQQRQDGASPSVENLGPQMSFTVWLLTVLALGFLSLRVYCKFLRHRGLWWDDYVLIAAWLSLFCGAICMSISVSNGYGKHTVDITPDELRKILFVGMFEGTFAILAAAWSKTSFALALLRLSRQSSAWIRVFIWFTIGSVNAVLGMAAVFTWVQCDPFQKSWDPFLPGSCWPKPAIIAYLQAAAGYSGAMDILLAFLPWTIIWGLTMSRKEKLGVLIAMSMGVFAGATSIVKVFALPTIGSDDMINGVQLVILAAAENSITIMAASIPILRVLVRESIRDDNGAAPPAGNQTSFPMASELSRQLRARFGRVSTVTPCSSLEEGADQSDGKDAKMASLSVPAGKIVQTDEVSVEYPFRDSWRKYYSAETRRLSLEWAKETGV